jgi:hypothetical protein
MSKVRSTARQTRRMMSQSTNAAEAQRQRNPDREIPQIKKQRVLEAEHLVGKQLCQHTATATRSLQSTASSGKQQSVECRQPHPAKFSQPNGGFAKTAIQPRIVVPKIPNGKASRTNSGIQISLFAWLARCVFPSKGGL